ncbi:hypothetical protein FKM82_014213 [Ascaphus truei]
MHQHRLNRFQINRKREKKTHLELHKKMVNIEDRKMLFMERSEKNGADDDAYLNSILPYTRELDPVPKLLLRQEINALVIKSVQAKHAAI